MERKGDKNREVYGKLSSFSRIAPPFYKNRCLPLMLIITKYTTQLMHSLQVLYCLYYTIPYYFLPPLPLPGLLPPVLPLPLLRIPPSNPARLAPLPASFLDPRLRL